MNVILQFWVMSSQIMSNRLLYQNICQCFKILRIRSILLISDFFLEKIWYFLLQIWCMKYALIMFRNDEHISITKLTSTKSWNKSFSFLQALANPAAFSEHQTTVSRNRLMPLNDAHISIIKLTSTKSWNKSFSFLQALANPAAFSEHQTTVSRKRLMPLNDVYLNMENMPLFSKFRLLTFMQRYN